MNRRPSNRPLSRPRPPVNPKASGEARDLLAYLYSVYGRFTLSGQHNQMYHVSEPSERVQSITGRYPLIWGGEWGFSDERHDIDNVKYRPRLLDEIRAQHEAGRIIVLTWHQASPTVGEPCDFIGGVQIKISGADWRDLLRLGTNLHRVWQEHVDRLAGALLQLQGEGIPIVFRPYHEMNGSWFWWSGRPEQFKALWNMLFERLTQFHQVHNLLWAWNPDKPLPGVEDFFPGHETVDLLGSDIYPTRGAPDPYPQEWYDRMREVADGKPLALSEMSAFPSDAKLHSQPWAWCMCWDNLAFHSNSESQLRAFYDNPRVLSERKRP